MRSTGFKEHPYHYQEETRDTWGPGTQCTVAPSLLGLMLNQGFQEAIPQDLAGHLVLVPQTK